MGRSLLVSPSATPASLKGLRAVGEAWVSLLWTLKSVAWLRTVFSAGLSVIEVILRGIQTTSKYNFIDPEALQNQFM